MRGREGEIVNRIGEGRVKGEGMEDRQRGEGDIVNKVGGKGERGKRESRRRGNRGETERVRGRGVGVSAKYSGITAPS